MMTTTTKTAVAALVLLVGLMGIAVTPADAFGAGSRAFPWNAFAHRHHPRHHNNHYTHPHAHGHGQRAWGNRHAPPAHAAPAQHPANPPPATSREEVSNDEPTWEPRIDISAETGAHVIRMAIPGVAARDVQLVLERDEDPSVDTQTLLLSGVRRDWRQRVTARFARRVTGVPGSLTLDDLAASLSRRGELRVRVPRVEHVDKAQPTQHKAAAEPAVWDVVVRERAAAAEEAAAAEQAHVAKWGEAVEIHDFFDWRDAWEHVPVDGLPTYEHH